MAKLSGNYEVVYILNPNLDEEATAAMVAKYKTLVEQNGGAASGDVSDTAKLLFELPVYRGAAAEGAKIKDIPWPKDCLIVSIRRQEKEIIPNGSAQLMGGDMLTVLCSEQSAYFIREEIIQTCQQYGGNPHA